MSAGTGIRHSEYNASSVDAAKLLQIWVFPKVKNIKPVYDQRTFAINDVVISPDKSDQALNINQDARFSLVNLEAGKSIAYQMKWKNSGLYLFVIERSIKTNDLLLSKRGATGIIEAEEIKLEAAMNSEVLAIEVPLNFAA
jgi:quercetin 2,3-dioxygenase